VKTHTIQKYLTVLFSIGLLLSPAIVFAAAPKSTTTKTSTPVSTQANVLKISPVRTDLSILPGESGQVKLIVSNITKTAISVAPIENDFVAGPKENGEPAIILSPTQYAPTHSLKRFMGKLPSTLIIPANSSSSITLTISVPKSAQAGGYFGAVRFSPSAAGTGNSVNLSASVASIILLTVPGPTTENVGLTNFDIQQYGSTGTNFRNAKDLSLYMRFENEGNVQEAPFGQIYVEKGKKLIYTYNFNQSTQKEEILPDSARRWTVPLSGFGTFGKYSVGANLTYGENNQKTLDITKTVWIIPTTFIIAAIVGVVILIVIIVSIWLFLRSYKKRILRHSRR
jgi:hypothetical protein